MWIERITRKQLLEILQAGTDIITQNAYEIERDIFGLDLQSQLYMGWAKQPDFTELPSFFIVSKDMKRDFLAWAMTYLTNYRPFTAFFRIFDEESINQILQGRIKSSLGKLDNACVGLILTEALTYLNGQEGIQLSPHACTRTYSFAMARALYVKMINYQHDSIRDKWLAARKYSHQPYPNLKIEALKLPWTVILSLASDEDNMDNKKYSLALIQVIDYCRDIHNYGDISDKNWISILNRYPSLENVRERMKDSREKRVITLERVLETIISSDEIDVITEFLCGYLINRISPGTMDHINITRTYLKTVPSIILWYGLCAGLHNNSKIQSFNQGLGRRIMRDLIHETNLLTRPYCDISLAELEMITQEAEMQIDFPTERLGQLEIEIMPGISTIVKWPGPSTETNNIKEHDRTLFTENIQKEEINRLQSDMDMVMRKIGDISKRLGKLQQGNYYQTEKKGKGRKKKK